MKFFANGILAVGMFLASLVFTGCNSLNDLPPVDTQPITPVTQSTQAAQAASNVAVFHVGDTVNVTFSGAPISPDPHEEQIKEDGTITLYLIGAVKAAGKTAGELQTEILTNYVPKYYVRLTVTVKPGERYYFVTGEVKAPGKQIYTGETTVLKAISTAGGFRDFASHTVKLIRTNGDVREENCDNANSNPALDLKVYPGDQIVVKRSIF